MAKAYREGPSWSYRLRIRSLDIYRSGFASEAAANKSMAAEQAEVLKAGKAAGLGPHQTTVASAFLNYGRERLPHLKGADKDANRINRYLRASNLPTIHLKTTDARQSGSVCYWVVHELDSDERAIPKSLKAHRAALASETVRTDKQRGRLARMRFADVTPFDVQQLIDAMVADGYAAATIDHERAELRRVFSYAKKTWSWTAPAINPASPVNAPAVDNARDRVLTNDELKKMSEALANSGNCFVVPLVCLMLETAMRSCEPLTYARWGDVAWGRRVLRLRDAKAGKRDVPLSPGAMAVLADLRERAEAPDPDAPIFPTTYEAVKKAWAVARAKAGISDVGLHDLRHTAAT